jgi:hypothetical protein
MTVLDPNKKPVSLRVDAEGKLLVAGGSSGGGVTNLALDAPTATTQPITNSNGTGVTLVAATVSSAGLMNAGDKTKLTNLPDATTLQTSLDAKLDKTAKAASATTADKLTTARTINGVGFDGSTNITVADGTKVAKSGDTMTGPLTAPGFIYAGVTKAPWASTQNTVDLQGGSLSSGGPSEMFLGQNIYYGGAPLADRYVAGGVATTSLGIFGGQFMIRTAPAGTKDGTITWKYVIKTNTNGSVCLASDQEDPIAATTVGSSWNAATQAWTVWSTSIGLYVGRPNDGPVAQWYRGAGNSPGNISVTTTQTSYNTNSDYRLKEDIKPLVNASSVIQTLNPINFAWKADGSRQDGFIAHDLQAAVPYAVTGQKDAMNGQYPAYQSVDLSKLVPLLVASLQEALARLEVLEARNAG